MRMAFGLNVFKDGDFISKLYTDKFSYIFITAYQIITILGVSVTRKIP